VVFHTAGVVCFWGPGLQRVHSVHVDGTRNVLSAVSSSARIVHTSSIVAVGANRTPKPVDEEHAFQLERLRVDYVQAKRRAEQIAFNAAHSGQRVVIVNPSYLVGPEDHERTGLNRLCQRFWTGRIRFVPPAGINVVDVRDVAAGHLLAAEHGTPGRRYLLGGEDLDFRTFFHLLADVAGLRPRTFVPLPWWLLRALSPLAELRAHCTGRERYPSRQHARLARYHWYCSSARAIAELGYRPRAVRDSLADLFAELQRDGRVKLRGVNRWWMRPAA
jgi:dihydroflavonol-4-reductase